MYTGDSIEVVAVETVRLKNGTLETVELVIVTGSDSKASRARSSRSRSRCGSYTTSRIASVWI